MTLRCSRADSRTGKIKMRKDKLFIKAGILFLLLIKHLNIEKDT